MTRPLMLSRSPQRLSRKLREALADLVSYTDEIGESGDDELAVNAAGAVFDLVQEARMRARGDLPPAGKEIGHR